MVDENDTDGRAARSLQRRRLLKTSGVVLATSLAGCSGSDDNNGAPTSEAETPQAIGSTTITRSRTRTRTRARTRTRSATQPAPTSRPRTQTQTRTNTATATATPVARTETAWLRNFNYADSSRQVGATIYNPTSSSQRYDLTFYCLNADGWVVYYAVAEGDEYTSSGFESEYSATIPAYIAGDVEYYSIAVQSTDSGEYTNLYRYPSRPPQPPSPFSNDFVSNPGQYASAEVAEFDEDDYGRAELITLVENTHDETMLVRPTVTLQSDGGVTLASRTGQIFPLQPDQTARCVSQVTPSGYELSEVASQNATIDDVLVMRMPPLAAPAFEEVGRDTVSGNFQVELRNSTAVGLGAFGVLRWLRDDELIDVVLESTNGDISPGERFTLDFGKDRTQGEEGERADDYRVVFITNDTLFGSYQGENGENYVDFTAPFSEYGDPYGTFGLHAMLGVFRRRLS